MPSDRGARGWESRLSGTAGDSAKHRTPRGVGVAGGSRHGSLAIDRVQFLLVIKLLCGMLTLRVSVARIQAR
jgi:hypothetical protein